MRYSKQRDLVYEIVKNSHDHPTADTIYLKAREEMPNISLGTVYRNLTELVESNQILRVIVPGDSDHFDHTLLNHSHFLCKECKSVTDLNKVDVDDLITTIEKNNKVKILSNQISFIGICPKCQN
jgi:Fur family peroxide stress response transcriptional regulator